MNIIDAPEALWRPPQDNQAPPRLRPGEDGNEPPPLVPVTSPREIAPQSETRANRVRGVEALPVQALGHVTGLGEGLCITWEGEPELLTSFFPGQAYPARCFAFNNTLYAGQDGSGATLVAFYDGDHSGSIQVWRRANVYTTSGVSKSWSLWYSVEVGQRASCPTLAATSAGVHLVWTEDLGLFHVALLGAGPVPTVVGDPTTPVISRNSLQANLFETACLRLDDDGWLHVVFTARPDLTETGPGAKPEVHYTNLPPGGTWSPPVQLSDAAGQGQDGALVPSLGVPSPVTTAKPSPGLVASWKYDLDGDAVNQTTWY